MYNILIVSRSKNNSLGMSPFVYEQGKSLEYLGNKVDFFQIEKGGFRGYFDAFLKIRMKLSNEKYDIIHSHYGLSSFISLFQSNVKKFSTYHGSDFTMPTGLFSLISCFFSDVNIFVSPKIAPFALNNFFVLPCGIDLDKFIPLKDAWNGKEKVLFSNGRKVYRKNINILFSGSFNNKIKNPQLAKKVISKLDKDLDIDLIELKDFERNEVNILMNICNLLLMTSFSEGSPQVVKEAMSCNCPVVSTNVGSVKELIEDLDNCFVVESDEKAISSAIEKILSSKARSNGRNFIRAYSISNVAAKLNLLYGN